MTDIQWWTRREDIYTITFLVAVVVGDVVGPVESRGGGGVPGQGVCGPR